MSSARRPWTPKVNAWLRDLPPGAVCAVIGIPGTGKTPTLQAAAPQAFKRRVIFNPYERLDRLGIRNGKKKEPWGGKVVTPEQLAARPRVLDAADLHLVVCPERDLMPKEYGPAFDLVASLVWQTQDVDLIAEECALYSRACEDWMLKLATGGGHVGMRFVLVSQSLTRFQIDARRAFSHLLAYAQGEPADIQSLKTRCGKAFAASVQASAVGDPPHTWRLGDALE